MYWPWPPMLNRPQRKANATARPVRISGVAIRSVCWRLLRPRRAVVARDPREQPVQAGAVEDRLVGRERVVAGRRTTRPPTGRPASAVTSGVTIPPARGRAHARHRRRLRPAATGAPARRRGRGRRRARSRRRLRRRRSSRCRAPPRTRRPELADDRALVDHEDPVRERQDLLELERDEQDRPGRCRAPRRAAGARTRSRRRRGRASAARRPAPAGCGRSRARSRPSAGCRPRAPRAGVCGAAAAHVELLQQLARALDHAAPGRASRGGSRLLAVVVQRDVLGERELEHEAAPLAILGDVAHAGVELSRAASPVTSRAVDRDRAGVGRAQARDAPRSARSARSRRPRRARRSRPRAPRTRRRAPPRGRGRRRRGGPRPRAAARPGCAGAFSTRSSTSRPTISRARLCLGRALARDGLDRLAAPQHRDPVGDLEHLLQLVADEDDRGALRGQAADDLEQLLASCGVSTAVGSSRISTVGAAVERLQDLDPLLLADA